MQSKERHKNNATDKEKRAVGLPNFFVRKALPIVKSVKKKERWTS